MYKIFIDGKAGTTGLRIYERLRQRDDLSFITLSEEDRKNTSKRKEAINSADLVMLCLPDDAAREAVSLIENENTVVFDTSTAHRTDPDWAYGFCELSAEHREKILTSKRIAVPGCHASGFIALVYPLVEAGLLDPETALVCHSLTGYSGGGKKMIAEYEAQDKVEELYSPRQYGLTQSHKHLKEMKLISGLNITPVFCPIVDDYYSGMEVTVPLFTQWLKKGTTAEDIKNVYRQKYTGPITVYDETIGSNGFVAAGMLSGNDTMHITVLGNEERILPVCTFDNLGKGASGAAIQCLNIKTGADETKGLII